MELQGLESLWSNQTTPGQINKTVEHYTLFSLKGIVWLYILSGNYPNGPAGTEQDLRKTYFAG